MKKPFTVIAVIAFVFVSLAHLLRFYLGWEITIDGFHCPMWPSAVGAIVAGGLAFLLWRESQAK